MAQIKTLTVNGKTYTVNDPDSVSYGESQNLTEEQKKQGRQNIGAAADEEVVKTVNGHAPDEDGAVRTINDTKAGSDAWSSKNTVDKLCPSFTESGSVVVCEPVGGYPLDVVSHIAPIQKGNPSTDNICPINGHTSATLWHGGRQLFDKDNIVWQEQPDGGVEILDTGIRAICKNTNTYQTYVIRLGKADDFIGKKLTLSANISASGGNNPHLCLGFRQFGTGTNKYIAWLKNTGSITATVTDDPSYYGGALVLYVFATYTNTPAVGDYGDFTNLQIEFGSTASAYEPYRGETLTVDFGQTVYGGTFDWQSGELVPSWVRRELKGNESWYVENGTNGELRFLMTFVKAKESTEVVCSHFPTSQNAMENHIWTHINLEHIYFQPSADIATTVSEWNAYLKAQYDNGTPVVVSYKPNFTQNTVQLTPTEVLGLDGVNILYSDTGDTTVNGKADPRVVIQDLYNKINALSATMTALTGV